MMVRMRRGWVMNTKKVNKNVSNAKEIIMMIMIVPMTLMKMELIMRMRVVLMLMLMLMKCLPGFGSERAVGTTASRAIVMKILKKLLLPPRGALYVTKPHYRFGTPQQT